MDSHNENDSERSFALNDKIKDLCSSRLIWLEFEFGEGCCEQGMLVLLYLNEQIIDLAELISYGQSINILQSCVIGSL